uniref:Mitogen-activated protein kinase n=1 Tax=Cyanoptyche gloeocystis TaxID=77922 RepID=A0A7S2JNX2_9EUKA|mmetsp:Transcript_886/g.1567  ORF Transcript_886/g.1567 Transcript_886/m.1567 type:complete len:408 (+) Transcript_886:83-1306(+)
MFHSFMVCGTRFDVDTRYTLIKPIGQGAYGVVCSAHDSLTGEKVAIKKITKAFEHLTDLKRTLREIKLLRHFDHENIISIRDIMRPISKDKFEDVYIVTPLMDTDLHQIISSQQPISDDHCQYFLYQVLRGLKYINSAHVLHRDLKPSNLLVNRNCDLKICDFGLARLANPSESATGFNLTEYVATRWYRAPEIMLSSREYTKAIDVWSTGCIFAELLGRKPLFPGKDYIHQLNLIIDVLGCPTDDDIKFIEMEKARRFIRDRPFKAKTPWQKLYPNANALALDLLDKMLVFNPAKRITVEEALEHPYMASLHDPTDEPVAHAVFNFDFERSTLTAEMLKDMIYHEMLAFHPEAAEDDYQASQPDGAQGGEPDADHSPLMRRSAFRVANSSAESTPKAADPPATLAC